MGEQELNKAAETEQNEQPAPVGQIAQDDPNEVKKYRNMLVVSMITVIALFAAWHIYNKNIVAALVAMILCALPLKDASSMLKNRAMMQRNGAQRGNIIGVVVLAILDFGMWTSSFVNLLLHMAD